MKLQITPLLITLSIAASVTTATIIARKKKNTSIHQETSLLWPYSTCRRWVWNGTVDEDLQNQQLFVAKDSNPRNETTTLVTFKMPAELQGRRCTLLFDLRDCDIATGTRTVDVFTSVIPERYRDQHLGRIQIRKPGSADWIQSYHGMPTFICPAGKLIEFEFVGVGDEVAIRWDIGVTGPRILVF